MPALPLDEAGKYVAGAYVVFVALILIYVAIMAAKLARIERELGELADLAEWRALGTDGELLALGVSHKTAPLELRERLALTEGRASGVLRELVDAAASTRPPRSRPATAPSSTWSPPTRSAAESLALGRSGARGRHPPDRADRAPLLVPRRGRR